MRWHRTVLRTNALAAAVAALAAAGCGGGETTTVTVEAGGAQTTEAPANAADPDARSEPADIADALASQTVSAQDSKDGKIDVAILALKVEGRLMRLTLAFTPRFPSASPDESISLYEMHGDNPVNVTLVDPVNLKRYLVVKDSEGQELAPNVVHTSARNGGTATGTWTFAAPPANVEKLDVQIGQWPPFSEVEIQR